jgi:hypothetical protein
MQQFISRVATTFALVLHGVTGLAGTTPSIGTTTFNNAFSATTNLLPSTPSPGSVANLGNNTETTGILPTGWDAMITAPTANVSMSASAAGANPGGASDFCIRMNSLTLGVTVQTTSIKSDDASTFSLKTVFLKLNITAGAPANMIITGYKAGVAVTGATFTVNGLATATWTSFDVTAVAAFGNVDEFRFTQAGTSAATITFEVVDQIAIAAAVLPLSLLNFTGLLSGNNVHLDWTTAEEQNTHDFGVQRSDDGINFLILGFVPAAGNSSTPLHYSFSDNISQAAGSNHYYRLKMGDIDAHFTYSPVLTINTLPEKLAFLAYPNPFRDILNIEVGSKVPGDGTIFIFDGNGRKILTKNIVLQKGNNAFPIPFVGKLARGTYALEISSSSRKQVICVQKDE